MTAKAILDQRQYFKAGFEYGMGSGGQKDSDGDGKKEIDCSHLVNSMLVGAGYRIPYEPTALLGASKYYDEIEADAVVPGDLILWRNAHKHVVIVEKIDVVKGVPSGEFFGSQSSTGPASAKFGPIAYYWKETPDKFLRPKAIYYHGPDNTDSADPVPPVTPAQKPPDPEEVRPQSVPAQQPSRKEMADNATDSTAKAREQWAIPAPEDAEPDDGYATKIPMDSGLFPIGTNLTWHGGVHLKGSANQPVQCMADGVVVAARLPEKDPEKPDLGSRNFVLVKHRSPQGDEFWSLYMHLLPILLKNDDPAMAEAMPWLFEMEISAEGEGTTNFRPLPSTAAHFEPPRTVAAGEAFVVIDQREAQGLHWYNVESRVDCAKGWIAKTARTKVSYKVHQFDDLKAGKVVKFQHSIQAGTCLGFMSNPDPAKTPFIHMEVFSEKLASGGWTEVVDDQGNDVVCDADSLKKLLNKSGDVQFLEPLTQEAVRAAYLDEQTRLQLWTRAYRFMSEWAVDWEDALQRFDKDVAKLQGPIFNKYRFWKDAESAGCDLPKDGLVYHYQPLIFKAVAFPPPLPEPPPPPASPDGFDIDWDFIAAREGTEAKVYVPTKSGTVIGVSGPTIASGFDLGQTNLQAFEAYGFSQDIQDKLKKFVGMKGQISVAFVKNNPCTLTAEQVKEINHKVKPAYAKKTEKYFNKSVPAGGKSFKLLPRHVQTPFVSVCFQYGKADTLKSKVINEDWVGAVDTLLHFTSKTEVVKKKGTSESASVMQYLTRRVKEARYLADGLSDPQQQQKARALIKIREDEWLAARGEAIK